MDASKSILTPEEDLSLFVQWFDLPPGMTAEVGDLFSVKGTIEVVYTKLWTDCGWEHDLFFDNDTTVVTKVTL